MKSITKKGGEIMHKTELSQKIARRTNLDERSSAALLNMVLSEITSALKRGQRVTLTGFGSFEIRKKKKRTMKNVHTGEPIVIPAHKAVGFVPGRILKWSVRSK